jgi:hypothetical protein
VLDVFAVRFCPGGEKVSHGVTSSLCSFCSNGRCISAQACEVPDPELEPPRPRLPSISRPVLVGACLAVPGLIFFAVALARHFLT